MNRYSLLLLVSFSMLFAKNPSIWDFQYSYSLKKDERAKVIFTRKGNKKVNSKPFVLVFRWTLYDGSKNLTVLLNYMGYPYQYALRKERLRDRIKLKLAKSNKRSKEDSYILIIFKKFDSKKMRADFNLFIKDTNKEFLVEFKGRK